MERHEHRRIVQVWFWISVGFALAMLAFPAPKLVNENVREPPDVVVIPHTAEYEFVELNRFGTSGSGNGQFSGPLGVALNTSGYVYVVDSYSNRVQVFTQTGQFVRTWGSSGSGNGNFISPDGIAVNASGYVYVADWGNHRVQVFTQTGQFVRTWGSYGSGDG